MEIERITSVRQIDDILPMMMEAHKNGELYQGKSLAAYIYYCAFNLIFPDQFALLMFKKDGSAKGYIIAHIGSNQFENHCSIVDAHIDEYDLDATQRAYDMIEEWAISNGCIFMETISVRAEAVCRRYGFEPKSQYMRKTIGGAK